MFQSALQVRYNCVSIFSRLGIRQISRPEPRARKRAKSGGVEERVQPVEAVPLWYFCHAANHNVEPLEKAN